MSHSKADEAFGIIAMNAMVIDVDPASEDVADHFRMESSREIPFAVIGPTVSLVVTVVLRKMFFHLMKRKYIFRGSLRSVYSRLQIF